MTEPEPWPRRPGPRAAASFSPTAASTSSTWGTCRYLEDARALGDLLIVGVNGDAAVRRLKGPGRPLMPAAERAEILARSARWTMWWSSTTTRRTVWSRSPAGRPREGHGLHARVRSERAAVLAAGGRVAIAGDAKQHSTRDVIAEILARFGRDQTALR